MATQESSDTIQSLETLFEIVEILSEDGPARLTDIADQTNVAKSTVHRHLSMLADHQYVTKQKNKYHLSYRFLDIGVDLRNRDPLQKHIRSTLRNIADKTGEFVGFVVEEHGQGIFLHTAMGREGVLHDNRVGSQIYLHQSAAGKVILANIGKDRRDEIISEHGLRPRTEKTITDRGELEAELETITQDGFAIAREEYVDGLMAVSVPVHSPDGAFAGAVLVAGPTHRMAGDRLETQLPNMLKGVISEFELNMSHS